MKIGFIFCLCKVDHNYFLINRGFFLGIFTFFIVLNCHTNMILFYLLNVIFIQRNDGLIEIFLDCIQKLVLDLLFSELVVVFEKVE